MGLNSRMIEFPKENIPQFPSCVKWKDRRSGNCKKRAYLLAIGGEYSLYPNLSAYKPHIVISKNRYCGEIG